MSFLMQLGTSLMNHASENMEATRAAEAKAAADAKVLAQEKEKAELTHWSGMQSNMIEEYFKSPNDYIYTANDGSTITFDEAFKVLSGQEAVGTAGEEHVFAKNFLDISSADAAQKSVMTLLSFKKKDPTEEDVDWSKRVVDRIDNWLKEDTKRYKEVKSKHPVTGESAAHKEYFRSYIRTNAFQNLRKEDPKALWDALNTFSGIEAEDKDKPDLTNYIFMGDPEDADAFKYLGNPKPDNWMDSVTNMNKLLSTVAHLSKKDLEGYIDHYTRDGNREIFAKNIESDLLQWALISMNDWTAEAQNKGTLAAATAQNALGSLQFAGLHSIIASSPYLRRINNQYNMVENIQENVLRDFYDAQNPSVEAGTFSSLSNSNEPSIVKIEQFEPLLEKLNVAGGTLDQKIVTLEVDLKELIHPNAKMLMLANDLSKMNGVFTLKQDGWYSPIKQSGMVWYDPKDSNSFALALLNSPLSVKETIGAIAILQYPGKGIERISTPAKNAVFQESLIDGIKGLVNIGTETGIGRLSEKVTEGDAIISGLDALTELQTGFLGVDIPEKKYLGFAGSVQSFVNALFGKEGQFDQLGDLFSGAKGNDQIRRIMEETDKWEENEGDGVKIRKIMENYILESNEVGKAHGRAAALEVFIAYKLARYSDPSGRVSDADYKNALAQISGTGDVLTTRASVLGAIQATRERVLRKLTVQKSFQITNWNKPTPEEYRKVLAAKTYYSLITQDRRDTHHDIQQFKVNLTKHNLSDTGVKLESDQGGGKIFQVMMKHDESPALEDYGGVYVVKDPEASGGSMYRVVAFNPDIADVGGRIEDGNIEYTAFPQNRTIRADDGNDLHLHYKIINGNVAEVVGRTDDTYRPLSSTEREQLHS